MIVTDKAGRVGLSFFQNRLLYANLDSSSNDGLLLAALSLDKDLPGTHTIKVVKFLSLLKSYTKYNKVGEYELFARWYAKNELGYGGKTPIGRLLLSPSISTADTVVLKELPLSSSQKELLSNAVDEIVINESLALGRFISEDELIEASGDGSSDPGSEGSSGTVDPTVPFESFHYAQLPLAYADVEVAPQSLFANITGFTRDDASVKVGVTEPYAWPCKCSIHNTTTTSGSGYSYVATPNWITGNCLLYGKRWKWVTPPGSATLSIIKARSFTVKVDDPEKLVRKILVEFKGSPMASLKSMSHPVVRADFTTTFKSRVAINPFQFRWLADNLLEIVVNYGLQVSGIVDIPSKIVAATIPSKDNSACIGSTDGTGTATLSHVNAAAPDAGVRLALGPLDKLRFSNETVVAGQLAYQSWTITSVATGALGPSSVPAWYGSIMRDSQGKVVAVFSGLSVKNTDLPAELAAELPTSNEIKILGEALCVELEFAAEVEVISISGLKAKLGGYSSAL